MRRLLVITSMLLLLTSSACASPVVTTIKIPAEVVQNGDGLAWHDYAHSDPEWVRQGPGPAQAGKDVFFEGPAINATDWFDGVEFNGLARYILVFDTRALRRYKVKSARLVQVPSEAFPVGEASHLVTAQGVSKTVRSLTDGKIIHFGRRCAGLITPKAVGVAAKSTRIKQSVLPLNKKGKTLIGLVADSEIKNRVVSYANVIHWWSAGATDTAVRPYLLVKAVAAPW